MKKLTATTFFVGAALLSSSTFASSLRLQEYKAADGAVFPVTSVLASGEKDAILFDAQFSKADGNALVKLIKNSNKNLKMIYITAGDPDYYFGLQPLLAAFPDVSVVASPTIVKHIKQTKDDKLAYWGPILGDNAPSQLTVPQPLSKSTLMLEGHKLEVKEMGTYQAYIWEPNSKTIFGGVSLTSGMHVWTADTQTLEARRAWVASLEKMKMLKPTTVIPGHYLGAAANGMQAIDFTMNYLNRFEQALKTAKSEQNEQSKAVISIMKQSYPSLPGESDLELGSKVNTGEMSW